MVIRESSEDYLECILMLELENEIVRSIDIANTLSVSKPSVSVAMKKLGENDFIVMEEDNSIHLTEKGRKIAEEIYERHKFFSKWLVKLGVDEKTAIEDACKIEHAISPESFEALKKKAMEDK